MTCKHKKSRDPSTGRPRCTECFKFLDLHPTEIPLSTPRERNETVALKSLRELYRQACHSFPMSDRSNQALMEGLFNCVEQALKKECKECDKRFQEKRWPTS